MKKVLFATTALVMTAGIAAAQENNVAVTGDARMGLIYDGEDAQFSSRARIRFTATGESDAGLSYGATFRVDHQDDSGGKASNGTAGAVWISGAYGKLEMGDVVSAAEEAIGDLYAVGYTEGGFGYDVEEFTYLTGDGVNTDQGPNLLYSYSFDRFSFYASASDGVDTDWATTDGADEYNEFGDRDSDALSDQVAYSIAAKYDAGNWWAALSYAKHDEQKEVGVAAGITMNQFSAKAVYLDYQDRDSLVIESGGANFADIGVTFDNGYELEKSYGLSAEYNMDALTIGGFWRRDEFNSDLINPVTGDDFGDVDADSFGLGAEYDLGGGAVLAGGIIDTDYLNDTVVDAGIRFKF
ncbi:porin [Paracoccus aerodenitrificans]|uniref:porin n=1 Tax=Paracoccus aerodenitrificans TaxID=3017781 RepID=UPI0022F049FC|nr:porin [Paracoccus aerodenitrificans]WBU64041.1 porin [Paracoccus aerodenitrificans]